MLRKKGKPEALGAILSGVLEAQQKAYRPLAMIQEVWPKLVGEPLAAHSKPVSLRQDRLIVHVDQPGDSFMLNFRRPQLLKQLNKISESPVSEIVFRAGDV